MMGQISSFLRLRCLEFLLVGQLWAEMGNPMAVELTSTITTQTHQA